MTDDITVAEAREELEKMRFEITAYLSKKLSDLHKKTGLITTCVTANAFSLSGGFPKQVIDLTVHNVEIHTDIGKYKGDSDA